MAAAAPGPAPHVNPPPHPLYALTSYELRAFRRQLEDAISGLAAGRSVPVAGDDLRARLDAVLAEQESRIRIADAPR